MLWTAEPELLLRKVDSVVIFAGDAADDAAVEYNVQADPTAFVSVMTSRLPIKWVPAFDGGLWQAGSSSFTSTSDEELLRGVRPEVRQWFDRYIGTRLGVRNLWAAGLLADEPDGATWIESTVRLDDNGTIDDLGIHRAVVEQLVVTDRQQFERWMVTATNAALRSL